MLGLISFFVPAFVAQRTRLTLALAILASAFKMTLAQQFVGLLLLRRRISAAALVVAVWLALNALGFWCIGIGALATYRHNVAIFEALGVPGNVNGPDPWLGISLPRLDWVFLFYGITGNLPLARLSNLVCSG